MAEPKKLTDRQLASLSKMLLQAKRDLAGIEETCDALQSHILAQLELRGTDEYVAGPYRLLRCQSSQRAVDLAELLVTVGRARFNQLTAPKLNTQKWNAAIQAGLVATDVVQRVETVTPTRPWVKVTEVA